MFSLKPDVTKISVAAIIFSITIFLLLPVKINRQCEPNETCPSDREFIKITEVNSKATYHGVNYALVCLEAIGAYLLSAVLFSFFEKSK